MGSSIKLGRVFGIEIGVHWSWIFIFAIVTWSFATSIFGEFYPEWTDAQRWIGGAFVALIFFLSVLAHELSHAVVSNRNGLPVKTITLFVFGGVANLTKEPESPGLEFRIAIVGPAMSLTIGALFAALWFAVRPLNDGIAGICANLAVINASLPGFPLDGGRVFRSIVWHRNKNRLRATRTAARAGEWIAYGIMGIGVLYTVLGSPVNGIWFLLIGLFLRSASAASYQQLVVETTLAGIPVRDVMQTAVASVPPDLSVEELVQEHVLRRNARCFAVIAAGDFAGLVTLSDIRKLPRDQWPTTSVYRAMTPASRLHSVGPEESLAKVLQMMAMFDVNQLPVIYGRELVGMLNRADVLRFIQVRQEIGDRPSDGMA